MAFRGLFFAEADEHLDVFAVDLHETGPSGGDVHWRGAATGESRASFEGLIQIDPGAQQTHTYLQIHSMMLSPKARIDAIPSVLVSADDVSASHGGTVGRARRDGDLLHAEPRPGPRGGRPRDRRGLLRAADRRAAGRAAAGGRARARWPPSWRRPARTSRRMPPVVESTLDVRADFPILAPPPDGRPLVYLDSAATSQKPEVVIEALADHLRSHNANVHRGVYALAQEADAAFEGARRAGRRLHRRRSADDDLHQERDRGDQPRRLRVGPGATSARATPC